MQKNHVFNTRVYYEDTDAGGVVYHSQYLNFMERARTEHLSDLGYELTTLKDQHGVMFVVRHVSIDFKKPAVLGDRLCIRSKVTEVNGASLRYHQEIHREGDVIILCHATISLACVNLEFKPTALPSDIKRSFGV